VAAVPHFPISAGLSRASGLPQQRNERVMSIRTFFVVTLTAALIAAAPGQSSQSVPATPLVTVPSASGNGQPPAASADDPGFLTLRLWRRETNSSTEKCMMVEADGRFHREWLDQDGWGTSTKAFENRLTTEEMKRLSEVLGSREFRAIHYDVPGYSRSARLSVDVWRKEGSQRLHFPNDKASKTFDALRPLLQWWKQMDQKAAPQAKAVTRCTAMPQVPAQQSSTTTHVAPQPVAAKSIQNADEGLPGEKNASIISFGPLSEIPFSPMRFFQHDNGLQQKCMMIEQDGSFHREETSVALRGTHTKAFAGKLSPADLTALAQIAGSEEFRSIVQIQDPRELGLLSSGSAAINVWRQGSVQELFFSEKSLQSNKGPLAALMRWWKKAEKLPVTPLGDEEIDSCRPRKGGLDDLLSPSAASEFSVSLIPAASTQSAGVPAFSRFRITRLQSLYWVGSISLVRPRVFEHFSDCLTVRADGFVRAERHNYFFDVNAKVQGGLDPFRSNTDAVHSHHRVKVFEGTLTNADFAALRAILDSQAFRKFASAPQQFQSGTLPSGFDILDFEIVRGAQRQQMRFRTAAERQPAQSFLDPLVLWWKKTSAQLPEARNATANNCALP